MTTKIERESIHEVLKNLEKQNRLTPDEVIREAEKPDSPLHSQFTWDIAEAARERWIDQARQLISSFEVTLIVNKHEYRVQEFVEHPTKPEHVQGYTSIGAIKSSKMLAREFMERELATATGYVARTTNFAEILGLKSRVESLIRDLDDLRGEAAKQPSV